MSFILLVIWQFLFVLQVLEWPLFGLELERPVTAMVMIAALCFLLLEKREKFLGTEFWLLTGFVVSILLSALANGWLGGGVSEAQLFILTAFLPFVLYSNHASSIGKQHFVIGLLLLNSLFMISNGMAQQAAVDGIGWAGSTLVEGTRITYLGLLEDPNDLGQYFVMCLPFAAYFLRYGRFVLFKFISLIFIIFLCYGIYMTNSRGTLLGAMGLFALFFFYRFGAGKAIFASFIFVPIVSFIFSNFRTIDLESSAMDRAETWYTGMQLLEQNPFLGVGMGNFTEYSQITAHNSFVLVMSELGFIGYMLWLSLIVVSYGMSFSVAMRYRELLRANGFRKLEQTDLNRALALNNAILFSMTGFLFCAFFLSRSYSAYLFILCAFCTASYLRVTTIEPAFKFKQPEKLFGYTLGGSFFSIAGMYAILKVLI